MKLKLTSLLVAVMFSAGVLAADSAREDVFTNGSTHVDEKSRGWDAKRSIKDSGSMAFVTGLSQAFPVTNEVYDHIWETKGMTRDILAMVQTGGNILGWGDLHEYRKTRLARLSSDPKNEPAMVAYRKLSAITDEAGLRQWAIREATALYVLTMRMARQNLYASINVGNRPLIRSVNYYDIWRPTVYSYGLLANNVMCALAESVSPVQPDSNQLPAKLVEAYLELPVSVLVVPEFTDVCVQGTWACQPTKMEDAVLEARIGGALFRTDGSGVSITANGSTKFFGEGMVCGREWNFTEDMSKAESIKDSDSRGKNTTKGSVVIKRDKAKRAKE